MGTISHSTIKAAQAGDRDAFEQIYDAYFERIARYAARRVLDHDAAQDISAHIWLKVVDKLGSFTWQHEHAFTGWIFRIANNEVNTYFRKGAKYKRVNFEDVAHSLVDENTEEQRRSFEQSMERNPQYLSLHKHIASLSRKQQDIIHLYYFERLSYKEIAIALNMRNGAVRMNISRALANLHAQLAHKPEFAHIEF